MGGLRAGAVRSNDMRILIVGAGPTGLLLGIELARRGVDFRIIDRNAERSQLSKALAVQIRTLEIYDALGVAEEAIGAGQPFDAVEFHPDRGRPVAVRFDALKGRYTRPLILEQSENERILEEKLTALGVRVERNTRLVSLGERQERFDVVLSSPEGEQSWEPDVVVGCDGASSTVRRAAGLSFEGHTYEDEFILADVQVDWPFSHDCLQIFIDEAGLLAAFPMAGERRYRLFGVRKGYRGEGDPSLEEFAAAAQRLTRADVRISNARWLSHYRVHCRGVPRYSRGRLFLAGDAAHVHSPAGGQGMNTGLQDAWNLGWKLAFAASGLSSPAILDTYDPERRPFGEFLLSRTDAAFRAVIDSGPTQRFFRRFIFPGLARYGFVQRRFAAFISQIGIRYAGGELIDSTEDFRPATLWPGRPPVVGERAPDVSYRDQSGANRSLFADLRGTGYHLYLLHDDPAATDELRAELLGRFLGKLAVHSVRPSSGPLACDSSLQEMYRLPRESYLLVRPDGYIASVGKLDRIGSARKILGV